jgi:hypothetical protein
MRRIDLVVSSLGTVSLRNRGRGRSGSSRVRPVGLWLALAASSALGCGLADGGQSYDDGSDDLGHGSRPPRETTQAWLASQPSVHIAAQGPIDPTSSFVGDLDGDGLSDLVVAAHEGPSDEWGAAYVFYGRSAFPAQLDLADADFVISEVHGQIAALGDVNGDGYADFGVLGLGQTGDDTRSDLFFGSPERSSGMISSRDLESSIGGGAPGTELEELGLASRAGDVNGDGFDDLLASGSYASVLILGRAEPFGQVSVATLGGAVFRRPGATAGEHSIPWRAEPVAAGDLDGDGYADFVLADNNPPAALYYGRADAWSAAGAIPRADALFRTGVMRSVGDWNGDGYPDLGRIATVGTYTPNGGVAALSHYVAVSPGGPERFQGPIDTEIDWPPADDLSWPGTQQVSVGDINGDGRPDLVLGEPREPGVGTTEWGAGAVFVLPGSPARRTDSKLGTADAALRGEWNTGGDRLGGGVSANGDINGDGYRDVLVIRALNAPSGEGNSATLILGAATP